METVLTTFLDNTAKFSTSTCFLVKESGGWRDVSWSEVLEKVTSISLSLKEIGVARGDSVAILAGSRPEWTLIDLAIMSIGAVTVPIYKTLSTDQITYILDHSNSKVLFVEDQNLLQMIKRAKGELSVLQQIFLIEKGDESFENSSLASLMENKSHHDTYNTYKSLIKDIKSDDIATCVYTSGTTGEPKGADLTHANILGEVSGLREVLQFERSDVGLLFLPLAHVVARALQFYQLCQGCIAAYAESIEKLPENLIEVRPHFMVVVPRIMEKIYEKIVREVEKSSFIRRFIFKKSVNIGMKAARKIRRYRALTFIARLKHWIVQRLVFAKLHKKLGGRLKMVISGGAPLPKTVAEFFHAAGCLILEGYGLTETMAAITINKPSDFKFGTVGKPLSDVKIRLAEDSEILVKGPQVFNGYRKTMASADEDLFEDGWFKTGDIGEFSRDGFLRITGRKKELIVTSAGKNIVPQRVEEIVKSSPYIKDVIVYGDSRKFLSALVIPDFDRIGDFAKERGGKVASHSELLNDSDTYQLIKSEIECKNDRLARHETIKKFVIIDRDFSQESGELTPTLKMKRNKIYEHYKDLIEGMYQ